MTRTGVILALLLAAVSAVGGGLGYLQARSGASLAAGLGAAVLLGVGLLAMSRGWFAGRILVLAVALALLGRFLPAYFAQPRVWPSLILIALAGLAFGFGLLGAVLDRYRPARVGAPDQPGPPRL